MSFTVGQLVQRSDRWLEQHGDRQEDQLGIVVGFDSSWEGEAYIVVHWEGLPCSEAFYPDHIAPVDRGGLRILYRDG